MRAANFRIILLTFICLVLLGVVFYSLLERKDQHDGSTGLIDVTWPELSWQDMQLARSNNSAIVIVWYSNADPQMLLPLKVAGSDLADACNDANIPFYQFNVSEADEKLFALFEKELGKGWNGSNLWILKYENGTAKPRRPKTLPFSREEVDDWLELGNKNEKDMHDSCVFSWSVAGVKPGSVAGVKPGFRF